MPRLLVIRFGSLGDLCLLAWSLSGLAARAQSATGDRAAPRPHVTLVVKSAFAPLMAAVPGVDAVVPLEGRGGLGLWRLGTRLRRQRFDTVLDAHGVLRSALLCGLLGRRPTRRIRKDTAARLALLRARRAGREVAPSSSVLRRSMLWRFDEVLAGESDESASGLHGAGPGAALLAGGRGCALWPHGRPAAAAPWRLGLAPGARWDTKRWPEAHWAEFLSGLRRVCDAPVEIFLGARERAWYRDGPLARAASAAGGVTVTADLPLPELARRLATCRVIVTNDSGLLHLAETTGRPVLALFGPTVEAFGYFPLLAGSRVLERDLPCRPCSRNGSRPCWRGDLACLQEITPASALAALQAMPAWRDDPPPRGTHA